MDKEKDSKVISILKRLGRPPGERPRISGILTGQEELAGFNISDLADGSASAARLTRELGESGLNIRLVIHHTGPRSGASLLICVETEKLEAARKIIAPLVRKIKGSTLEVLPAIHAVSIYPHREDPAIAGEALVALREVGIDCLAVGAAGSVISLVVPSRSLSSAVETLENTFQVG